MSTQMSSNLAPVRMLRKIRSRGNFSRAVVMLLLTVGSTQGEMKDLDGVGRLYSDVRFQGSTGDTVAIEKTLDAGAGWELVGQMTEDPLNPGEFLFKDPDALYNKHHLYRALSSVEAGILTWMATYPISYLDFEEAHLIPFFEWSPFPGPVDSYQLDIHYTLDNREGAHVPLPELLLSVPDIPPGTTTYSFEGDDPELLPGRIYAYSVGARIGDRLVRGRPVLIEGFGTVNIDGVMGLPSPITGGGSGGGGSSTPDLGELFQTWSKLNKKKQELHDDLENNPLVQESQAIRRLFGMLNNHEEVKDFVLSLLEGQLDAALNDPETALKVVCYLIDGVNLLKEIDLEELNLSQTNKLCEFLDSLPAIKTQIQNAIDAGQGIADQLQALQDLVQDIADEGIATVIEDQISERLMEYVTQKLIEKGIPVNALYRILTDIINAGDALITIADIEELCEQINRLLIEGISGNPSLEVTSPFWLISFLLKPGRDANCTITFSFKKRCFKQTQGGGPHEGTWEEHPIRFDDGSTEMTFPIGILPTSMSGGKTWAEAPLMLLDTDDLDCPAGEGPCMVYYTVTQSCPGSTAAPPASLLAGFIDCN